MLLMAENGIKGGVCHAVYWYTKHSNKYMKDYDKNKESLYFKYWDVNNLYGLTMLQKLPVNILSGSKILQFNEDFIISDNEESDEEYFLAFDFQHP